MNSKFNFPKKFNHKEKAAIAFGCPIAIFLFVLSIKLMIEERFLPSTGFMIVSIFMFICLFFVFYNPGTQLTNRIARRISKSKSNPIVDFELIYASKDPVEISHIKEVLKEEGITCFIFDENTSGMMRFLQEIEIKVLVHKDDYEKSIVIVNEIMRLVMQPKSEKQN